MKCGKRFYRFSERMIYEIGFNEGVCLTTLYMRDTDRDQI